MSMIAHIRKLSEADLSRLLDDPAQISDYLYEEDSAGFGAFEDLDLDKAWHAIHFLLTGSAWEGAPPLNFILNAGVAIGEEDVGYGPARGFTHRDVLSIAEALRAITPDELAARLDPQQMIAEDIYPTIWNRAEEQESNLQYVRESYDELRDFVIKAADSNDALLVFMN